MSGKQYIVESDDIISIRNPDGSLLATVLASNIAGSAGITLINASTIGFPLPNILGTGGLGVDGTPLGDDLYERFAATVASASAVVVDSYIPPDGSVTDIVWDFTCKQTTGTGNPTGAKFRANVSVRRAGSVLTIEDAFVATAGSSNEIAPTVALDTSAAPLMKLTVNEADATKTLIVTGVREVVGTPKAW